MKTTAVVLEHPKALTLRPLDLREPSASDVVVDIEFTGISTGTEKLLWSGTMPSFPGMGYPLVPGYEAVGVVREGGSASGRRAGERVFVPGAQCYRDVRGLFGAAASQIVVEGARTQVVNDQAGDNAVLLALAATAHHAVAGRSDTLPDLIVGHGVLGRLIARLTMALGGAAPIVWEKDQSRRQGGDGYQVIDTEEDTRKDYRVICDVSGDAGLLDTLIARLAPQGEIILAGFYSERVSFAFPPAFMREARFTVAAEWKPADLAAVQALLAKGALSLDGLITHRCPAEDAVAAYETAFTDPQCLKMVLDWRATA